MVDAGSGDVLPATGMGLHVEGRPRHTLLLCGSGGELAFVDVASGAEVRPRLRCHEDWFSLAIDPVQPTDAIRFVTSAFRLVPEVVRWTLSDDGTVERMNLPVTEAPDDADEPYSIGVFGYGRHDGRRILAGAGSWSHFQV